MIPIHGAVAAGSPVVAMGRAELPDRTDVVFPGDLGPSVLGYAELYEHFAVHFEEVSVTGVVPFGGAVFAEELREFE